MTAIHQSRVLAEAAADKLRAYAQPQRLMILSCLLLGEQHVGEIEKATEVAQPALSQQLAALRKADLVKTRRDAKLVYYRLADDGVAACVRTMEAMFGHHGEGEAAIAPPRTPGSSSKRGSERRGSVLPIPAAAFARIV